MLEVTWWGECPMSCKMEGGLSKRNYPGKMSWKCLDPARLYYNQIKHYNSSYYLGTYRQMDATFVVEQLEHSWSFVYCRLMLLSSRSKVTSSIAELMFAAQRSTTLYNRHSFRVSLRDCRKNSWHIYTKVQVTLLTSYNWIMVYTSTASVLHW